MSRDGKSLAEGFVTEARVQARVLGLRLLEIDATVVVSPADVPPARARSTAPATTAPLGRDLARATRFIDEGEAALAAARRHASPA